MKKIVMLVFILFLVSCGESERKYDGGDWTTEETDQDRERETPKSYITIENTEQKTNFWGTKSEFKVFIKNIAKHSIYKDLTLRIQWLSKTGSVIEERTYTRYDYFQPNHKYEIGFELPPMPDAAKKYQIIVEDVKFSEGI